MKLRATTLLAAALALAAPATGRAALTAYTEDFESLVQADPFALGNAGWLVFGNVSTPGGTYLYGYGPFPAPNGGSAFCSIDVGQGGVEQGAQQLSVYSDYNNADHANGNWIESNVFLEQTISAAEVGQTWVFAFDAKLGNLLPPSTALAFIKTLNPAAGYALTNFLTVNTTAIPVTWNRYTISIQITPDLVGQILQTGFANTATNYVSSGVYYDNLTWGQQTQTDAPGASGPAAFELRGAWPNPVRGSTRIGFSLAQGGAAEIAVFDVAGRRVAMLFRGAVEPGAHAVTWNGRFDDGRLAPAGVYRCVLQTAVGRQARSLVVTR
uniref:FlgD/Vpr Ig-like domain-containing protein n=1 Tax=Eiseniibacteriota bacterium TaxID=2212470 RepID=A0A832I593_UNCEI